MNYIKLMEGWTEDWGSTEACPKCKKSPCECDKLKECGKTEEATTVLKEDAATTGIIAVLGTILYQAVVKKLVNELIHTKDIKSFKSKAEAELKKEMPNLDDNSIQRIIKEIKNGYYKNYGNFSGINDSDLSVTDGQNDDWRYTPGSYFLAYQRTEHEEYVGTDLSAAYDRLEAEKDTDERVELLKVIDNEGNIDFVADNGVEMDF